MTSGEYHLCGSVEFGWPLRIEITLIGRQAAHLTNVLEVFQDPGLEESPRHPLTCKDESLRCILRGSIAQDVGKVMAARRVVYIIARKSSAYVVRSVK